MNDDDTQLFIMCLIGICLLLVVVCGFLFVKHSKNPPEDAWFKHDHPIELECKLPDGGRVIFRQMSSQIHCIDHGWYHILSSIGDQLLPVQSCVLKQLDPSTNVGMEKR